MSGTVESLFDQLEELANDDQAGTVVVLAVWAGKAANGLGRLF